MGKYLDKNGVSKLWGKTKDKVASEVKSNVTDKLGVPNGIATLGADSKLTASQLPALKTVNGESIVGSGNIAIDLSIYTIVDSLPQSNQNPNKIYLVLTSPATNQEQDVYTEYIWTGTAWEKLGEYKATVDLTPYVQKTELDSLVGAAGYAKKTEVDGLAEQAGYLKKANLDTEVGKLNYAKQSWVEDKGYQTASEVSEAIAAAVTGGTLDLSSYVKFTDIASASKAGAMSTDMFNKLNAIEAQATKDEAITDAELDEILV